MKWNVLYKSIICFAFLLGGYSVYAQGKLSSVEVSFTSACVRASYNDFPISFSWTAPMPNPANQYIIELSDANGDFTNAQELSVISSRNTSLNITTSIKLPSDVYGDGYKIRISSTNPPSSVESKAFSAYAVNVTSPMVLNNGVANLSLCPGHTQVISVDKKGEKAYKWYKDNKEIPGKTEASLEVSEPGVYYAVVDYGSFCSGSSNSRSNNVTVTSMSGFGLTLKGTPEDGYICKGNTYTMKASVENASYTYTWYRNGVVVDSGAGKSAYTTPANDTVAGTYYVEVSSGGGCSERSNTIEVRLRDGFTVQATANDGNIILPGSSKLLSATTTAQGATYQWYKGTTRITSATSATYAATEAGTYSVEVTSTGTCATTIKSQEITLVAPTNYEVTIGYKGRYEDCIYSQMTLEVKNITAISGTDRFTLDKSAYSQFTYAWRKNGSTSSLSTSQDITINRADDNGNYTLQVSATNFTSIPISNSLKVQLLNSNYIQLNNGEVSVEFCTDKYTLSANINESSANYTWYKNDEEFDSGVGKSSIDVTETGDYYVSIATSGDCPAVSNYVSVVRKQINVSWVSNSDDEVFLEYKKPYTIRVTTNMSNPTTTWLRNRTPISGVSGLSYQVNEPGGYAVNLVDGSGCGGSAGLTTSTKRFVAPMTFSPTINYKQSGSSCNGTEAVLELQKLYAILDDGSGKMIEIPADEFSNFQYQWIRNNNDVNGEVAKEITITNTGTNLSAEFKLQVIYGTIVAVSNGLEVDFVSLPDVSVTTPGTTMLCGGGTLTLTASETSSQYAYQWYHNDTALPSATSPTYVASVAGNYHVKIANSGCEKSSAPVSVSNFFPSLVTVDVADPTRLITITGSDGYRVTASGADRYQWVAPDNTVISTAAVAVLNQSGTYTLTAYVGTCSTTINLQAQVVVIDKIPNVVTPNGDGINDTWMIPSEYSNKPNVKITIYSQEGKEEIATFNYQNNWPQNFTKKIGKRGLIYLYIIEVDGQIKEQGTITLLQ